MNRRSLFKMSCEQVVIQGVRQRPILYDKAHRDFHDHFLKDKAWEEVANETGLTVGRVIAKWRYLRDRYTREAKRAKELAASDISSSCTWSLYNQLLFLEAHIQHRKLFVDRTQTSSPENQYYEHVYSQLSTNNVALRYPQGEIEEENSLSHDVKNEGIDLCLQMPLDGEVNSGNYEEEPYLMLKHEPMIDIGESQGPNKETNDEITPPSIKASQNLTQKLPNGTQNSSNLSQNLPNLTHNLPNMSQNLTNLAKSNGKRMRANGFEETFETGGAENDDEDKHYCLSLVHTMRRLPPIKKRIAKMEIEKLLFDIEFGFNKNDEQQQQVAPNPD